MRVMNCAQPIPVMGFTALPRRLLPRNGGNIIDFQRYVGIALTDESSPDPATAGPAVDFGALIVRVATDRDRASFVRVYEYFAPRVKSYLIGQRVPADVADEVVQEVMLAVWNKAGLFNPSRAAASTWIFAIARNKRVDRIRKDMNPDLDPQDPSLMPADFAAADDSLLDGQRKVAVGAALAELPEDQRDVIELSFMKGLSHSEIAGQLGLPLGTVKSRIRLAFQRLRGELGEVL